MKKNISMTGLGASVALVTASLVLAATGCSGGQNGKDVQDAEYAVSGTVYSKWIYYECDSVHLSMDTVAFSRPTPKRTKDTDDSGTSNSTKKPSAPAGSGKTFVSKPVKVPRGKVPTGKPKKPRGYSKSKCSTEYELYIKNGDGIFEQDVLYTDYATCDKGEKFTRCTD